MKRMFHTIGGVEVSWEKGSDQKRVLVHGHLGSDFNKHILRFDDVGKKEATVTWHSGADPVQDTLDSFDLRALAGELLAMADTIDKRQGVTPAAIPHMNPMAAEFFAVFDKK